ncbi:MAG: DUF1287 domain-containing protein [Fimbriimonadaceae bacterium]
MALKILWVAIPLAIAISATAYFSTRQTRPQAPESPEAPTELLERKSINPIVKAAREQLINPARYSGAYYKIDYPMGDVPANRGACTDVIIRALRKVNIDLQQKIQEDADKQIYPKLLLGRDRNIDHRRCPNQIQYFSSHASSFPTDSDQTVKNNIQPGDIIFWKLKDGKDHVGIASDILSPSGHPLIIHNIGPTVTEADVLFAWKIVAHFRITPKANLK